jgi:hypothetical protein
MSEPTAAEIAALPGVTEAATAARDAVDRLIANRAARRRTADLAAESAVRGAFASSVLAGADIRLEQLRTGDSVTDPVVRGALRVAAARELVGVWRRAPVQALARLHSLAAADLLPAQELGRPRQGPGRTEHPLGIEVRIPAAQVAGRLHALAALASAPGLQPTIVVAAIVEAQLLALDPFGPGSDLVARAAARLVLAAGGVDPNNCTVPEAGHLAQRDAYASAAREYAAAVGGAGDARVGDDRASAALAGFVIRYAGDVELGAAEGLSVLAALR